MALDKQFILESLQTIPGQGGGDLAGRVRHIAACEGHIALKFAAEGTEREGTHALGARIYETLARACAARGEALLAVAVMFISEGGQVVAEHQYGEHPGNAGASGAGGPGAAGEGRPGGGVTRSGGQPAAAPAGPGAQGASGLPNVKHIVAVGAGKGGVGKSSVAVNLAVGLARRGLAVGLMDGDIYGPSVPTMLGLHESEQSVLGGMLQPFYVHGVKAITIGKLVDPDRPLIWRGPMAHGAFKQLVEQTAWGELDYLIIDLPPGTGDVSLTMSQMLQLTGAVIVCTPQRVAQDDAVRAVRMFQQLKIEVLGVVENMSVFIGDDGKEYDIFGRGGAEKMAARLNVPFLGALPITMALRENSDQGDPSANFREGTPLARALDAMVENTQRQVSLAAMRQGQSKPTLKIS